MLFLFFFIEGVDFDEEFWLELLGEFGNDFVVWSFWGDMNIFDLVELVELKVWRVFGLFLKLKRLVFRILLLGRLLKLELDMVFFVIMGLLDLFLLVDGMVLGGFLLVIDLFWFGFDWNIVVVCFEWVWRLNMVLFREEWLRGGGGVLLND